jgi:alkylated DNA repair dioxygenase AlkB
MGEGQADLFEGRADLPAGFRYQQDLLTEADERRLVQHVSQLSFAPFEFHGFFGKRRVVFFGWKYNFGGGGLQKANDMPAFLMPVREAAASRFGLEPSVFQQVLVTEYDAGAAIGWHKDRSVFGDVIGVSLSSPCTFRFRKKAGVGWERRSLRLEPRSAYVLQGPARTEWEHSIPAVTTLRYSITFRTLK